MNIDLHRILRERIGGWKGKLIPGFLISALERMVHQRELNEVLDSVRPAQGTEFARKTYDYFDLTLESRGEENIPDEGRFIFASNHPLGGLDGIGLIKVLGRRYGDDGLRFLVNDMLMNVEPLRPVFLPINKYGSQGRGAAEDLTWQKSFVQKAVEYRRDIIPVRFEGRNRMRFYRTARWRKRLGLKVNIEQAMLPAELCASRGKKFRVTFGRPIGWQEISARLSDGETPAQIAASIRSLIYGDKK